MKKIIASLFLAILLFSTFTANAFNHTEFNYEEIYFSIPEYCSLISFEDDYYTEGKWQTDDASVEFTLKWEYNYDELYLPESTQEEIVSFYHSYFYPDENQLKIDSAEVIDSYDSDKVLITGAFSDGEVKSDYTAYLFFTDEYVYVLEFKVFGEDTHGCVGDVIYSLYIEPYNFYVDSENYDDGFEFLGIIPIVFVALIGVFFKFISNNSIKAKKSQSEEVKINVSERKTDKSKFELNGKNINFFNERFIVGSKNNNFAVRELERERKEREKMYH